jgi:hypothetical protein
MKQMLSSLMAAIVLTACMTVSYLDTTCVPDAKFVVSEQLNSTYTIRVEFVILESEELLYPDVAQAFMEAVSDWSKVLPIEVMVAKEGLLSNVSGRPDIIRVRIFDIQTHLLFGNPLFIGLWLFDSGEIWLDADSLTSNPELALHVARHELGHVFGLPHIDSRGSLMVSSGDITVAGDKEGKTFLMYPFTSDECLNALPSELEILIARQYILYQMTNSGGRHGKNHFCLTGSH